MYCKGTGLLGASLHLTPILFISGAVQSTFKFDPTEFDPDTSIRDKTVWNGFEQACLAQRAKGRSP